MKKSLGFSMLVLVTNCAFASSGVDPKIDTLKKMYVSQNLDKYSTSDFKGIMNTAPIGSEVGCIDWDPTVEAQDTDKFAVL